METTISEFLGEFITRGVLPIIMALLSIMFLRRSLRQKSKLLCLHGKERDNFVFEKISAFRSSIDTVVVNILLPVLILILFLTDKVFEHSLFLIFLGLTIPAMTLLANRFLFRFTNKNFTAEFFWMPSLMSTFGGGNRGVLFLILLTSAASVIGANFNLVLATFIALDLGNYLFLLFFKKLFLNNAALYRDHETVLDEHIYDGDGKAILRKMDAPHYIVSIVSILSLLTHNDKWVELKENIGKFLSQIPFINYEGIVMVKKGIGDSFSIYLTSHFSIISFFVFLSMFTLIVLNNKKTVNRYGVIWGSVLSILGRFLGIGLIIFCVWLFSQISMYYHIVGFDIKFTNAIIFALCVFIILPPSSVYSAILLNTFQGTEREGNFAAINVYSSLTFLLILIVAVIIVVSEPNWALLVS